MAFDFKKEHKVIYMPKNLPEIVTIPTQTTTDATTTFTCPTRGKSLPKSGESSSATRSRGHKGNRQTITKL